jgi:hypothetical protein
MPGSSVMYPTKNVQNPGIQPGGLGPNPNVLGKGGKGTGGKGKGGKGTGGKGTGGKGTGGKGENEKKNNNDERDGSDEEDGNDVTDSNDENDEEDEGGNNENEPEFTGNVAENSNKEEEEENNPKNSKSFFSRARNFAKKHFKSLKKYSNGNSDALNVYYAKPRNTFMIGEKVYYLKHKEVLQEYTILNKTEESRPLYTIQNTITQKTIDNVYPADLIHVNLNEHAVRDAKSIVLFMTERIKETKKGYLRSAFKLKDDAYDGVNVTNKKNKTNKIKKPKSNSPKSNIPKSNIPNPNIPKSNSPNPNSPNPNSPNPSSSPNNVGSDTIEEALLLNWHKLYALIDTLSKPMTDYKSYNDVMIRYTQQISALALYQKDE